MSNKPKILPLYCCKICNKNISKTNASHHNKTKCHNKQFQKIQNAPNQNNGLLSGSSNNAGSLLSSQQHDSHQNNSNQGTTVGAQSMLAPRSEGSLVDGHEKRGASSAGEIGQGDGATLVEKQDIDKVAENDFFANDLKSNLPETNCQVNQFQRPVDFALEIVRLKQENALLKDQVLQNLAMSQQNTNNTSNPRTCSQSLPSGTIGSDNSATGFGYAQLVEQIATLTRMLQQKDIDNKLLKSELDEYKTADPHQQCKQTIHILQLQLIEKGDLIERLSRQRDEATAMATEKIISTMKNDNLSEVSGDSNDIDIHDAPEEDDQNNSELNVLINDLSIQTQIKLFGFQNLGNTCYAGAALQCIQAISVQLTSKPAVSKFLNAQALCDFYNTKLRFPNIFSQNDSAEALLQLAQSQINQLNFIQIKLKRNTKCRSCNTVTCKYEIETMLQLPCSHSHFSDCFRTYLMAESLANDNKFECIVCATKTDADTWLSIQRTESIFIVQLNRFTCDGIHTTKKNDIIEMPLKFVINNQLYELFAFVVHLSHNADKGHYIAYSNCCGIWNKYDDDYITTSVDITEAKNNAYYYCYRRIIVDYAAHTEQQALLNIVEKSCVYCKEVITGPATYYKPDITINIAGAMVEHFKQCKVFGSFQNKIKATIEKHDKNHKILKEPFQQNIKNFFTQSSKALTESHLKICTNIGIVKKAIRKTCTKILRDKLKYLPTKSELEQDKKEIEMLKAELAAIACTWTYKWDPLFVKATPYFVVDGEVAWAGYVPPAIQNITSSICDEEGNVIYGTNGTRENLQNSIYDKKRCAQDKKLERQAKIAAGVPLTLVEQKAHETQNICKLIEQNKDLFKQFRDWMDKYKLPKDLKNPYLKKFEWEGPIFCDGITISRLSIFKDHNLYKAFLQKHGKLQIQKICDSADPQYLYVRLLDSANQFTQELINGLNNINEMLLIELERANQEAGELIFHEAQKKCHIRQVDYTRDMKGAFYSFDMKTDFDVLSKLLGMRKATHDEYTSINSCFQFLNYAKGKAKDLRMKLYNKIFHLIQSEQGKKKVSMNLKALLGSSATFFQKIDNCIAEGLSRCEFSQYFITADELKMFNLEECNLNLNKALKALNQVPSVYNTVPIINFLDDYFETFASNLFVFEEHQWAIVYGKNSISSYMGIIGNPCKMGKAEFISRFTYAKVVNIIDNTTESESPKDTLVTGKRVGPQIMQIPMQALGVTHKIENMFDLEETKLTLQMDTELIRQVLILDAKGERMFKIPTLRKRKCNTNFTQTVPSNKKKNVNNQDEILAFQSTNKRDKKLKEKEQNKDEKKQKKTKKSYQGGGIILSNQQFYLKHTSKGNTYLSSLKAECVFRPEVGASRFYAKYNCTHCKSIVEMFEGEYYLFC